MALEYDEDQVFMVCDRCGEMSEGEYKDEFSGFLSERRAEGWRTARVRGEWENRCPKCK